MIWVTNKSDLEYYSGKPANLCYCEYLATASDMYLQGDWNPSGTTYTTSVEVWGVSGNDILEVVSTDNYKIYFGVNPITGRHYFTFRLKSYTAIMCSTKCFLMRIGISNVNGNLVFAAFTERYCIPSCCEYVSGLKIEQDGYVRYERVNPNGLTSQPLGLCNETLIRIISTSDCYNTFNGRYFGKPATVLSGDYFQYMDISCFAGRVIQRPREITREYTYNCKPQRVESSRNYLFEGFETFPSWKMDEIESQLSSSNLYVDDFKQVRRFEYFGGTPFNRYDISCWEIFKLNATLNDCIQRQIFGCNATCDATNGAYYFVVPANYISGYFYDNNGNLIAESISGDGFSLLNWFKSKGLDANEYSLSTPTCSYAGIIAVTGNVIPQSIYYNNTSYANQIRPIYLEDGSTICDYIASAMCDMPDIGSITFGDMPCDAPSIGVITYGDISGTSVTITAQLPWVINTASATAYNNNLEFSLDAQKAIVAVAGEVYTFSNEYVANISAAGVPSVNRIINATTTNFPYGVNILVDTFGRVYFSGDMVIGTDNIARTDFANLIYQII